MKTLTALDSSVLASIAAARGISEEELRKLFSELSPDARDIALAVLELKGQRFGSKSVRPSEPAKKTARELLAWA